jgi:hypothetical protein
MTVDLKQIVRMQMAEIDRLRAEVEQHQAENRRLLEWIMGEGPDALLTLQKIYSDPRTSVPNAIKSATAALKVEHPTGSVVIQVEDWAAKTRAIRLRALERDRARWALEDAGKTIEGTCSSPPLASDHEGLDPADPAA